MFIAKVDFFETPEGTQVLELLEAMSTSEDYITDYSYSPHSEDLITFIEKHTQFLRKHPNTNALHYVSNLKIMCRRR